MGKLPLGTSRLDINGRPVTVHVSENNGLREIRSISGPDPDAFLKQLEAERARDEQRRKWNITLKQRRKKGTL